MSRPLPLERREERVRAACHCQVGNRKGLPGTEGGSDSDCEWALGTSTRGGRSVRRRNEWRGRPGAGAPAAFLGFGSVRLESAESARPHPPLELMSSTLSPLPHSAAPLPHGIVRRTPKVVLSPAPSLAGNAWHCCPPIKSVKSASTSLPSMPARLHLRTARSALWKTSRSRCTRVYRRPRSSPLCRLHRICEQDRHRLHG
jgi:hypothetical protein